MRINKIYIGKEKRKCDLQLFPGKNLYSGIKPFQDSFSEPSSLEIDLLNLASGIYAADLAIHREKREYYIRNFEIEIDVINLNAFKLIKDKLEYALLTVSKDNWEINFKQTKGVVETNFEWKDKEGAVLLFSGGIDSMSAACDFINQGKNLVLVSHNTHGNKAVGNCQKEVHKLLEKHYKQKIEHKQIKVYGRNSSDYKFPSERENTQRTRSFLFLSIAALVTRRYGFNRVLYMAENGQFAIHLPLNQARVGPFSTHTADPEFVIITKEIIQELLQNQKFKIENPFLYKTKAEVFSIMPKEVQRDAYLSSSCWMIARIRDNKHCGCCIPCISRRIAIEHCGLKFNEYATDIFTTDIGKLIDTDDKKRNIIDYLEFISKFKNVSQSHKDSILSEFPELINPSVDIDNALKLYNRVSKQSYNVLNKYTMMKKIIG
jgi:7-cyano-7-deazaguanine synthase in queuosine biosynthesis